MAPSGTALLVIDIQHELCGDAKTEIPHAARIKEVGQHILDAARKHVRASQEAGKSNDLEVLFVQHNDTSAEQGTLLIDSPPWKLFFSPIGETEPVLRKTVGDTFESNSTLADNLQSRGIQRIVAFGLQSEYCVRATCNGALKAGFDVTLLQGAHSTYDDGSNTAAQIEQQIESELHGLGVKIVPWKEWCNSLDRTG